MKTTTNFSACAGRCAKSPSGFVQRFAKDESGSLIVLTLVLLVTMLVMGGLAVDFMRFEAKRAELQSVSDRAVLAAANLRQDLDPADVVTDYFEKSGWGGTIIGVPSVVDSGNSRTVRVNAAVDMNTFYLRLIGIDQLSAPARSGAIEGIGKVEISLVLDISGSMRNGGSGSGGRFRDMQNAAISFANKVLDPANGGQVSLNIVPYAGQTNPGRVAFNYMNADPIVGASEFTDPSSCIEFESSDWDTSALPGEHRDQVPVFMYWAIAASVMDWGWCPLENSSIQYAFQDAGRAADFINGMRMHDGTGTHYAMKYGLAMLDPTTQPLFQNLNDHSTSQMVAAFNEAVAGGATQEELDAIMNAPKLVPDAFANRPASWNDAETKKILVLMTDGEITEQIRPTNATRSANLTTELANQNSSRRTQITSKSANVTSFGKICTLAKSPLRDITVYTVAFEVTGNGATQMRECASDASTYFPASGAGLTDVFNDIADQITDLRLNL